MFATQLYFEVVLKQKNGHALLAAILVRHVTGTGQNRLLIEIQQNCKYIQQGNRIPGTTQ